MRKEAIRRMDLTKIREEDKMLNEVEEEARKRTMHLLERAYNLKLEQEEEIQKYNRLILETKCRAIRDMQVLNLIKELDYSLTRRVESGTKIAVFRSAGSERHFADN